MLLLSLMLGTLVSEDLTCVAAGALLQSGRVSAAGAIASCAAGIFAGDIGLWLAGRACRATVARWHTSQRAIARWRLDERARQLEGNIASVLLMSRLVPGSRLPLYLSAGFSGVRLGAFSVWTLVAVLLWTPALVLSSAAAGRAVLPMPMALGSAAWASRLAATTVLVATVLAVRTWLPRLWSWRWSRRTPRWVQWEFWPMWLFYAPVALWIALLSLRYRGLATITAANPGIPDGGTIGESKFEILNRLPPDAIIPAARIECGSPDARSAALAHRMMTSGWSYPMVLKPDVGQRGVGVRIVRHATAAADYLSEQPGVVLAQPYHPGPFEAGVFYYRYPGEPRGRILSITDKRFPLITGDGVSSLGELIRRHPRFRIQARTFLTRHRASLDSILPAGTSFQLAHAGNHAQGTMFRDGMHLWTPALEQRIDRIAQTFPGFFVGRFDIRYTDVAAFTQGQDLAIVELNGATAESTEIYDPAGSLRQAYRRLFQQWSIVFAIGAANRRRGAGVTSMRRLLALIRMHLTTQIAFEISD